MRRNPPDLLFVPSHVIPPVHPRSVVTIHDLGYIVEPDCHEPVHRRQLEWTTRWNAKAASGIIAVSEATRRDLIERLGVDPSKIRVIPHGVAGSYQPAEPATIASVRCRYDLSDQYILAVGTIHPRKNLERLIQAFEHVALEHPSLQLVLCGNEGWRASATLDRARRSPFADRIVHIGYVPESDLPALYSGATVTAFVSLYEGFGLPAVESMACGTPVVAANRSALPEVCGDAALLADPFDSIAIAESLKRLLDDDVLRRDLIERGFQRAKQFTWQSCAHETLAFLRAIRDNS